MKARAWWTALCCLAASACGGRGTVGNTDVHEGHTTRGSTGTAARVAVSGAIGPIGRLIADAAAGDTVVIPGGVHDEGTIVIDRPLVLIGEAGAVLSGGGSGAVLLVQADDVTVTGLTFEVTGSGQADERAAIRVRDAGNCLISNNRIARAVFGIYLENTTDCVVRGNSLEGDGGSQTSTGNGIHAWSSARVAVDSNSVRGHRDGIYFEFVSNGVVTRNRSTGSIRYGLHFMFSSDARYEGNTFERNGNGVAVMYSQRVSMLRNRFLDNRGSAAYGLLLKDINNSIVESNRFEGNSTALHLEGSSRNRIRGNIFAANGLAIRLLASATENAIGGNSFAGNAFDFVTNSRSSTTTLAGNHWDRYRGYDVDGDDRGDVPFHPIRLFSLVVEQSPASLILLRSPFVDLLDLAERVMPALTPESMRDEAPLVASPSMPAVPR